MLALAHMLMDRGAEDPAARAHPGGRELRSPGSAFRPRDIYRSRKGLTVEIGNTDAEGRLILADALALADEEKPELIVDMATLTGAARVALGPEVPPFYTDDDALAATLARLRDAARTIRCGGCRSGGPMTSCSNRRSRTSTTSPPAASAGSITAALFLRRFVSHAKAWLHCDIYAWNLTTKPGRPEGGECQAARALYALLVSRYG